MSRASLSGEVRGGVGVNENEWGDEEVERVVERVEECKGEWGSECESGECNRSVR